MTIFTWWFHHLARFFLNIFATFFSAGLRVSPGLAQVNHVSVRLSSDNATSVSASVKLLDVCTCTHMLGTCLHVWAVRYCSLSCFFSPSSSSNHNPSLSLVLVLFSFSFSLPPFLFCSTSAHLLHLLSRSSLLQYGAVLSGHAASIAEKESDDQ